VTSLTWMNKTQQTGPFGSAVWWHQVAVIVPKNLRFTNVSIVWINGNHNTDPLYGHTEKSLQLLDEISWNTGVVAVVIYQVPNCPVVYANDPAKRHRSEDGLVAFGWYNYLNNTTMPEWLPFFPMAKAGFQCMKAVQEFLVEGGIEGYPS